MKNNSNHNEYWKRFCESGKIDDYLIYAQSKRNCENSFPKDVKNACKDEGARA